MNHWQTGVLNSRNQTTSTLPLPFGGVALGFLGDFIGDGPGDCFFFIANGEAFDFGDGLGEEDRAGDDLLLKGLEPGPPLFLLLKGLDSMPLRTRLTGVRGLAEDDDESEEEPRFFFFLSLLLFLPCFLSFFFFSGDFF